MKRTERPDAAAIGASMSSAPASTAMRTSVEALDAGQRRQYMGEQRPAADRHQAFVGDAGLGGEGVELAVALGGEG